MTSFLDTNILIRYLTGDDPKKADRAEKLLLSARSGRTTLFLTHMALAEAIWVLSSEYHLTKTEIADGLRRVLNTHNIQCDEAPLILATLALFESKSISFVDAYHATFLPAKGITEIYSYDTDFDQVPGITRREP